VFDGHGGHGCAEFLRDNLHNIVASQSSFPADIEQALVGGCKEAEDTFMRQNIEYVKDRSGSCATLILVTKGTCYIANIGDSRAILSK
jgi:protein phosphatase 2C family protein 2/3